MTAEQAGLWRQLEAVQPRSGRVSAEAQPEAEQMVDRPQLVFFHSTSSGRSRRVEGFLAQVLQRRANHRTFRIYRVDAESESKLVERFGVEKIPTLVVVEDKRVRGRLPDPRGCRDIEEFLAPWLR
jgi:thioredoxin-like negative regulator of GroEL